MDRIITAVMILLSFTFSSCKKFDISDLKLNEINREKFFSLPENAAPPLQRIVANMMIHDTEKPFVYNFIKKQGYPIWAHAKISIRRPSYNFVNPESDTLVSVPIVEEGTGYVKSVLAIKVNSEVWYKLLEGIKYRELPQEDINNPDNFFTVIDFLKLMMELEYEMFGHSEFEITDDEVLNGVVVTNGNGGGGFVPYYGSQLSFSNGCTIFNWGQYNASGFHIIHTEALCLSNTGELLYTLEPPEMGGGGGGVAEPEDEKCGRGFVEIIDFDEDGNPITSCIPLFQNFEFPCDVANRKSLTMDSIYLLAKVDSVLNSISNLDTLSNEKGFAIFRNFSVNPHNPTDTTFTTYFTDTIHTGSSSSIIIPINTRRLTVLVAILHTHPPKGFPAPSAKDIYELIEKDTSNFAGTFIVSANGDKYALTVTNSRDAKDFFTKKNQNLDGDTWDEDSEIGKAFKKAFNSFRDKYNSNPNKENLAYEMAMAAVLKQYDAGVTLSKKDTSGNFKPIVVNTTVIRQGLFKPEKTVYTQDCL